MEKTPTDALARFRALVLDKGRELYRELPWRNTRDPYAIWVSEVMLQQTQVSRVDGRWQRWLMRFPDPASLAAADPADVLDEWQGLGYNRRALAMRNAAIALAELGAFPSEAAALTALPGIGPATAAGIRAFAFDLHAVYLETNVRAVFLHELFPDARDVPDSALVPLVDECCPADASDPADDPRSWYYALLDYGAWLKKTVPNPARRSRSHVRQSRFEGSHRQKRAAAVRALLDARQADEALDAASLARILSASEEAAGREGVDETFARDLLEELESEGFCRKIGESWSA